MALSTTAACYLRVSTESQHCANQHAELMQYAAARGLQVTEYSDVISGASTSRPGLDALMHDARRRKFKLVVVWSLDRLGRNLRHLIETLDEFNRLEIEFVSLHESIDTSSAAGRLQLTILAALASFERERLRERTLAGLAQARKAGTHLGRPRKYAARLDIPGGTVRSAAAAWNVSPATACRWIKSGKRPVAHTEGTC